MHAWLYKSGGMHEVAGDQRWEAGLTSGSAHVKSWISSIENIHYFTLIFHEIIFYMNIFIYIL